MAFHCVSPLFQLSLYDKGKEEFHIKLRQSAARVQSYQDNTGKYLWKDVFQYIKNKWKDLIDEIGTDYHDSDGCCNTYIWIHVQREEAGKEKTIIKNIISDLNRYFDDELRQFMVPKLVTCICRQLSGSEKYFALALCEYQSKFGKDKALDFIHVYFRDIKTSQMYARHAYYDSDLDFDD